MERERLKEEERDANESLAARGSVRSWSDRKASRPIAGGEEIAVVDDERRRRTARAAEIVDAMDRKDGDLEY